MMILKSGVTDVIEFPTQIPIKIISCKFILKDDFYKALCCLVDAHLGGLVEGMITLRASANKNYYSATLVAHFQDREAFYAFDTILRAHPMVKMVL